MTTPAEHAATVPISLAMAVRGNPEATADLVALAERATELERENEALERERDAINESHMQMWQHLGATEGVAADLIADEVARRTLMQAVDDVTTDAMETLRRLASANARAEQLETALRPFVDLLNPKALMQGQEWPARFEEYQRIARAALDGGTATPEPDA